MINGSDLKRMNGTINQSSRWTPGVVSALGSFLLAYSLEGFRSLPLFTIFYIAIGSAWLAVAASRKTTKSESIYSGSALLLVLGIISATVNLFPLALALFVVFMNTLMHTRKGGRAKYIWDALSSAFYVAFAFALVLISGYIPLVVIPVAYVLAGLGIMSSLNWIRRGSAADWLGVLAGAALLVILVVFSDRHVSVGAAAAASCVAFLIRIRQASQASQREASPTLHG